MTNKQFAFIVIAVDLTVWSGAFIIGMHLGLKPIAAFIIANILVSVVNISGICFSLLIERLR